MSEESLLLVNELKSRVQQLFGEFLKVEKRNALLNDKVAELDRQIKALEGQLAIVTKKYESLKLAKSIESGHGDIRNARLRINKLVREIDKCVALLNE